MAWSPPDMFISLVTSSTRQGYVGLSLVHSNVLFGLAQVLGDSKILNWKTRQKPNDNKQLWQGLLVNSMYKGRFLSYWQRKCLLNNVERHMKCLKLVMERRHGNVWGCPVTPGQSGPQLVVLLTLFLLKWVFRQFEWFILGDTLFEKNMIHHIWNEWTIVLIENPI